MSALHPIGLQQAIKLGKDAHVIALLKNNPTLFKVVFETKPPFSVFYLAAFYKHQNLFEKMVQLAELLIQQKRLSRDDLQEHMQIEYAGKSILHLVAEMGTPKLLDWCIQHGGSLSKETTNFFNASICAAITNRIDILNHLSELDVAINATNSQGNTPLHFFVRSEMDNETASFLIAKYADINAINANKKTPLATGFSSEFFLTREQVHKIIFLLENGANLNNFSAEEIAALEENLARQVQGAELKDLQYLRALLKEKTANFTAAKELYQDAAASGHAMSALRLADDYTNQQNWQEALKWHQLALEHDAEQPVFDRAIYLAHELLNEVHEEILKDYYRDFARTILSRMDMHRISADSRLMVGYWINRLHKEIDDIPEESRITTAFQHVLIGFRQAEREGNVELVAQALDDVRHFMILLMNNSSDSEKRFQQCVDLTVQEKDITYFYRLSLQLAKFDFDKNDDVAGLAWFKVSQLLRGTTSDFKQDIKKIKIFIEAELNALPQAESVSLQGYAHSTFGSLQKPPTSAETYSSPTRKKSNH